MTSKKDIKILTQLLDLPEIKVVSHHQYKGVGIILQIESIKNESISVVGKKVITYIKTINL